MQDGPSQEPDRTRPPAARQLLPILLIAPAITAIVRWTDPTPVIGFWSAMAVAAAATGVLGLPVLFWALDHGRTAARWLGALGGAAAAVLPVVLLASGIAGQALLGGRRYLGLVLKRGAPIPGIGQIAWISFADLAITVIVIGVATGVIYVLVQPDSRGRSIATRLWLVVGTLAGALVLTGVVHWVGAQSTPRRERPTASGAAATRS